MRLSLAGVASGELESTRDNLLGRLYEPNEVASFEGVLGKDLSNPVPDWAEHRPEDGVVRYGIAPNMHTPNPDSGRGAPHINTQLFGILDEENRGKIQAEKSFNEPRGAPSPSGGTAAGGGTWS
jgi:phospholipase C